MQRPARAGASRRAHSLVVLAMAAAVALAGCGESKHKPVDAPTAKASIAPPSRIAEAKKLVFCSDLTYPPLEFQQGGQPAGADVEVGSELARRLGVTAQFDQTGFDGVIAALQSSKCDAIISGMNDTPARRKQVAFVDYAQLGTGIIVAAGNPAHIQSADDLSGKSVAVQVGTSNKDVLEQVVDPQLKAKGLDPVDVVAFPQNTDAINALRTGRVDAYVADAAPVAYTARQDPSAFLFVGKQIASGPVGIALRKDDTELAAALTKAVGAAYADGSMQRIYKKWGLTSMLLPEKR